MDPGGWKAVGLIASWFIPLVAIAVLAWFKPSWGIPILAALTAAAIALMGWRAIDEGELEDRIGPFTTIAIIAVSVAATALGHTRTRAAGIMLPRWAWRRSSSGGSRTPRRTCRRRTCSSVRRW